MICKSMVYMGYFAVLNLHRVDRLFNFLERVRSYVCVYGKPCFSFTIVLLFLLLYTPTKFRVETMGER